jgi:cysteine synthase
MAGLHTRGDVLVLHQASEPGLIDHYRLVATEILDELPRSGAIAVGIGTGLSITGIAGSA